MERSHLLRLASPLGNSWGDKTEPRTHWATAAAIVPLGLDAVSLYTQAGAHLIIDVTGWYT